MSEETKFKSTFELMKELEIPNGFWDRFMERARQYHLEGLERIINYGKTKPMKHFEETKLLPKNQGE